eukprot:scaffold265131_cov32-Tisochrysis_lutea.AAC.2
MGVPSSFMLRRGHRAANQGRASNQEARAPMAPGAQKSKSSILIAPGAPPSSSKGLPPRASSSSNPNESGAGVGIATRASRGKMERTVEATCVKSMPQTARLGHDGSRLGSSGAYVVLARRIAGLVASVPLLVVCFGATQCNLPCRVACIVAALITVYTYKIETRRIAHAKNTGRQAANRCGSCVEWRRARGASNRAADLAVAGPPCVGARPAVVNHARLVALAYGARAARVRSAATGAARANAFKEPATAACGRHVTAATRAAKTVGLTATVASGAQLSARSAGQVHLAAAAARARRGVVEHARARAATLGRRLAQAAATRG